MFRRILLAGMILILPALAVGQTAIPPVITITRIDSIPCVAPEWVQLGKQIRIELSGFTPNASVELKWQQSDSVGVPTTIEETITADSGGVVNIVRTVPVSLGPSPSFGMLGLLSLSGPGSAAFIDAVAFIRVLDTTTNDGDSDGIADMCDVCPALSNAGNQSDTDEDGIGDLCDTCPNDQVNDVDGDGLCADVDPCPMDPENDQDADGVCEFMDNCPTVANPSQMDDDGNGVGNACQTLPSCSDGVDNDADGKTDHPDDPGCTSPTDTSEHLASLPCDDGIDNDDDGSRDVQLNIEIISGFPVIVGSFGDPGCGNDPAAPREDPQCDNKTDDDGDTFVDWDGDGFLNPASMDPQCPFAAWDSELVPEPSAAAGTLAALFALGVFGVRRRD